MTPEQLYFNTMLEYRSGKLYRRNSTSGCDIDKPVGTVEKKGYLSFRMDYRFLKVHRVVWVMFNGPIPEGMQIDHIDGDRANNKIENLRVCYQSSNQHNRKLNSNSSSGVKGLRWHKRDRLWVARVQTRGDRIERRFEDREDAVQWLIETRILLHGAFVNHGVHKKDQI